MAKLYLIIYLPTALEKFTNYEYFDPLLYTKFTYFI